MRVFGLLYARFWLFDVLLICVWMFRTFGFVYCCLINGFPFVCWLGDKYFDVVLFDGFTFQLFVLGCLFVFD